MKRVVLEEAKICDLVLDIPSAFGCDGIHVMC